MTEFPTRSGHGCCKEGQKGDGAAYAAESPFCWCEALSVLFWGFCSALFLTRVLFAERREFLLFFVMLSAGTAVTVAGAFNPFTGTGGACFIIFIIHGRKKRPLCRKHAKTKLRDWLQDYYAQAGRRHSRCKKMIR